MSGENKVMLALNTLQELRLTGADPMRQFTAMLDLYQALAENQIDMAERFEAAMQAQGASLAAMRRFVEALPK